MKAIQEMQVEQKKELVTFKTSIGAKLKVRWEDGSFESRDI